MDPVEVFFWCVQAVALEMWGSCQCMLAGITAFRVCLFYVLYSQAWKSNTRWWYSCIQSEECIKRAIPETNTLNQYLSHGCLRNAFLYVVLGYSTQYRAPCNDVAMLTKLSFPLAVRKSEICLSNRSTIQLPLKISGISVKDHTSSQA